MSHIIEQILMDKDARGAGAVEQNALTAEVFEIWA